MTQPSGDRLGEPSGGLVDVPGLPASVRQRAGELLDGTLQVVPLRDAATVALLRDGADGLEVFMQRRTSTLAFAAGMYVFPGGRVEDQDRDPGIMFADEPPDPVPFAIGGDIVLGLDGPLDAPATYRSLVAAAVRETAEEAGVLLAQPTQGRLEAAGVASVRRDLADGVPLASALGAIGARLSCASLVAFAHWMTPAVERRRFDTRFFLAKLPYGQEAGSASGESDQAGWVRPAAMLARAAAGEVVMLPPTVAALTRMQTARDAASAIGAGHRTGLRPVLPHPFRQDGRIGWRLLDGYTGVALDEAAAGGRP